jgi:hypothetical protein
VLYSFMVFFHVNMVLGEKRCLWEEDAECSLYVLFSVINAVPKSKLVEILPVSCSVGVRYFGLSLL